MNFVTCIGPVNPRDGAITVTLAKRNLQPRSPLQSLRIGCILGEGSPQDAYTTASLGASE